MGKLILNRDRFLEVIEEANQVKDNEALKISITQIKESLSLKEDKLFLLNINSNGAGLPEY